MCDFSIHKYLKNYSLSEPQGLLKGLANLFPCAPPQSGTRPPAAATTVPKQPKDIILAYIELLKEFVKQRAYPGKTNSAILNVAKSGFGLLTSYAAASIGLNYDWTEAQIAE